MTSYYCQLCRMDMSIARIRTPDEPPDAAWNYEGCNYVGFNQPRDMYGGLFKDEECHECTTMDRTPINFYNDAKRIVFGDPLFADEDEDDEWLPENYSDSTIEPLEYDSDALSAADGMQESKNNDDSADIEEDDTWACEALKKIYDPSAAMYLPHGTWRDGYIYTRERGRRLLFDVVQREVHGSYKHRAGNGAVKLPSEHIAAPSCQSLQGINGHVLSAEQMKNCRTHRFLLAKPPQWEAEGNDQIFEKESSFVLSGESNGSVVSHECPYVYPPCYGVDQVQAWTLYVNAGCNDSDRWRPLSIHSYCLDMYAKASYRRLGRVDLDGIWHWREMQYAPESYNLSKEDVLPCNEILHGLKNDTDPWSHHAGDEWLAANPVEIPEIHDMTSTCFNPILRQGETQYPGPHFLTLPAELVDSVLSFLGETDMNRVADTCRTLRYHTQSAFKTLVGEKLPWLWEVLENTHYPESPDRPPAWDPCFPPGIVPPNLPDRLQAVEDEEIFWKQIVEEDADMHSVGEIVKTFNFLRREKILGPCRAAKEWSLREWQEHRAKVEDWIRSLPKDCTSSAEAPDWLRV